MAEKEKPKEVKPPAPPMKGVMAKRAAIEEFGKMMEGKVKGLQGEMKKMSKRVEEGVVKIQSGIQAQAKENEEAVAKIKSYVRDFYYG